MSNELKYWDTRGIVFPRPILEAEMDRLSSLMNHEGWPVLMDLLALDAQASARIALDPMQPQVQRDVHAATFKAVSWMLTLRERTEQLKDFEDAVAMDADEPDEPDAPAAPDSVLDRAMDFVSVTKRKMLMYVNGWTRRDNAAPAMTERGGFNG